MLDSLLRTLKDGALHPIADRTPLHPTTITLAGLAVGLMSAGAGFAGAYGLGLALWLLNRTLDGLDGAVARHQGKQTDLGGYIDLLADFLVYALVPLALAHGSPADLAAAGVLLAAFYVNAASVLALSAILERRRHADPGLTTVTLPGGLIEGTETVIFFALFFLLPGWLTELYLLMAALVALTVVGRLAWAMRRL
jgi:phosphatidylglycerophosphate synthase